MVNSLFVSLSFSRLHSKKKIFLVVISELNVLPFLITFKNIIM